MNVKKALSLITALFTCFILTISCFAFTDVFLVRIPSIPGVTDGDVNVVTKLLGSEYTATDEPYTAYFRVGEGSVWYDSAFNSLSYTDKVDIITEFITAINEADDLSSTTKQAIYTSVSQNIDDTFVAYIPDIVNATSADILGGLSFFAPFQSAFGVILGVGVILLVLALITSTLVDFAYLGSPGIMNWFLKSSEKSTIRLKFISADAQDIANAAMHSNAQGNVYLAYLRRRWVTYIVLSVCILYLLTGQIADFIGWILSLGSGIVK